MAAQKPKLEKENASLLPMQWRKMVPLMVACGYLKQKPRKRNGRQKIWTQKNGKQKSVEKDHSSNSDDETKEEGLLFEEDYHDSMNAKNLEKYFASLCEKLPKNSVIVIDNASYHSRNSDSYPKSNWRKQQLIDWLKEKNVTIPDTALRAELWTMAKVEREILNTHQKLSMKLQWGQGTQLFDCHRITANSIL